MIPTTTSAPAPEPAPHPPFKAICRETEKRYRLAPGEIHTRSRKRLYALPRHVAWYIAAHKTTHSLPRLGQLMAAPGDPPFDHTSVLFARDKIERLRKQDAKLDAQIRLIERALKGPLS